MHRPSCDENAQQRPMKVTGILLLGCCLIAVASIHAALPVQTTFTGAKSERTWTLKELNAELPSDWTGYEYLVPEFKASSSQRFELGLEAGKGRISDGLEQTRRRVGRDS
jgi:hypothetical protein